MHQCILWHAVIGERSQFQELVLSFYLVVRQTLISVSVLSTSGWLVCKLPRFWLIPQAQLSIPHYNYTCVLSYLVLLLL